MLIKIPPERKESSAARLIDYVQQAQLKKEDRPKVFIDNCVASEIDFAKLEIKSTQQQNTRAKGDKTYHLILSFSPEDNLQDNDLKRIVQDVAEGLGFGDHQRITAIHRDTENDHCHVVINKIHPVTHNINSPHYDGYKSNELAEKLEIKHKLERINHSNKRSNEIKYKKLKNGIKSFNQWVVEETKSDIEKIIDKGGGWGEVSNELAKHNLHIRRRGRGLVVADKEQKLFLKASSVSRKFSKLGEYDETIQTELPNPAEVVRYKREKLFENNKLWKKYIEYKAENTANRSGIKSITNEQIKEVYKKSKQINNKTKNNINLRGKYKKEYYLQTHIAKLNKIEQLTKQRDEKIKQIKNISWHDYLAREYTENGNKEALDRLKKSRLFNSKFQNKFTGKDISKTTPSKDRMELVDNKKIFLTDNKLRTSSGNIAVAKRILEMALDIYEPPFRVEGSKEFKKNIKLVAGIKDIKLDSTPNVKQSEKKQVREI